MGALIKQVLNPRPGLSPVDSGSARRNLRLDPHFPDGFRRCRDGTPWKAFSWRFLELLLQKEFPWESHFRQKIAAPFRRLLDIQDELVGI